MKLVLGIEVGVSPGDFVLDGDPAPPQFSAHFYCGQTAGCIKIPFGMDVGLSPGDFVLDGDPAPPFPKRRRSPGAELPNFRPMSIVAKRLDGSRWHLHGGMPWSSPHCARWGHSSSFQKRGQRAPNFRPVFVVAKRLDASRIKMPLGMEVGLGPGDFVLDGDPAPTPKGAELHLIFSPRLLWPNGCMHGSKDADCRQMP